MLGWIWLPYGCVSWNPRCTHWRTVVNACVNHNPSVCADLWLQCSVSFVHCNHRSGHLKTEHTESLFLLRRHLGNWPRSKHERRTAGSAWETWTVAAVDGERCARVRWEINFLLIFETALFFSVYPVLVNTNYEFRDSCKTYLIEKGKVMRKLNKCDNFIIKRRNSISTFSPGIRLVKAISFTLLRV